MPHPRPVGRLSGPAIVWIVGSLLVAVLACLWIVERRNAKRPSINEVAWALQDAQANYFEHDQNGNGRKDYWYGPIADLKKHSPHLAKVLNASRVLPCEDPLGLRIGSFYFHPLPFASQKSPPDQYFAIFVELVDSKTSGGPAFLIVGTPRFARTYCKDLALGRSPTLVPEGLVEGKETEDWLGARLYEYPGRR